MSNLIKEATDNILLQLYHHPNDRKFVEGTLKNLINNVLRNKIGFLRQWLNEDRITDPNKLVTNQELLRWFE